MRLKKSGLWFLGAGNMIRSMAEEMFGHAFCTAMPLMSWRLVGRLEDGGK